MPMSYVAFKRVAEETLADVLMPSRVYRSSSAWFIVLGPGNGMQMGFPAVKALMEGAEDVRGFISQAVLMYNAELASDDVGSLPGEPS